jgi:hypothetical protein
MTDEIVQVAAALLQAAQGRGPNAWKEFQSEISNLKLQRAALEHRIRNTTRKPQQQQRLASSDAEYSDPGVSELRPETKQVNVVLVTGFESFNQALYRRAAVVARSRYPGLNLSVFSDRDIGERQADLEKALTEADVFFSSLVFDYDQVEWLRDRIKGIQVRLVFESALELMSETKVGSFQMAEGGKTSGPPPAVKKLLGLFGSGREEDRLTGYLSFLKIGPKILKFFPLQKAQDLRAWCAATPPPIKYLSQMQAHPVTPQLP